MEMELRSIRAFVQVANTLSFTRAATQLHLSQPQLSMRIRDLEARVGFRLFDRTSRKVALTSEGERLLSEAAGLIERSDLLNRLVDTIRFEAANSLKIAAVDYVRTIRRRMLTDYMAMYPGVTIDVDVIRRTHEGFEGLATRRWDVGIVLEIEQDPAPEEFETLLLARLPVGLVLPAHSPLAGKHSIAPSDLMGLQVALFRRDVSPALHDRMAELLEPMGVRIARLPEPTEEGVREFVRQTGMLAMCARWWDAPSGDPEGITHRLITGNTFDVSCVMVRPRDNPSRSSNLVWALARTLSNSDHWNWSI